MKTGFQSCPHCSGKGYDPHNMGTGTQISCTVCKGEKIINMETGKPPLTDTPQEITTKN